MRTAPEGKGIFLWQVISTMKIPEYENDLQKVIDDGILAKFSHVIFKVADSYWNYNVSVDMLDVVNQFKEAGMDAWGFQYAYPGTNANQARQVNKAVERVETLALDGFVLNVEVEWYNRDSQANKYARLLREKMPDEIGIALSTFRFPLTYQPSFPIHEFAQYADVIMPQVYWMGADNAGEQLLRAYAEAQRYAPGKTFIPTGFGFSEHGYKPSEDEMQEFVDTCKALGLTGYNWWEWMNAKKNNSSDGLNLFDIILGHEYLTDPTQPPEPPPEDLTDEEMLDILWREADNAGWDLSE